MINDRWENVRLGDVVHFNPKETIPKNKGAKKIRMEKLKPFTKFIADYDVSEFKGGTKFRNGDTLLARITPCLENGKTAQVTVLNDDEVGFGSTEYIVLREKEGLTDKEFIYYLSISPNFRDIAINSMVGSSGRQRVQQKVLEDMIIKLPPISEQRLVSSILSCLDEKIELNRLINENLSELLQTVYQQQFGNTKNAGSSGFLADVCSYSKDRISVSNLTLNSYYSTENMQPNKAGATYATSLPTTINTTKCRIGDVLVSNIRPYFKKIVYCHSECGCSTDVLCFTPNVQELSAYLFSTLYNDHFFNFMVAGSKGTKMPRGDKQQIMSYAMSIPSQEDLNAFNEVAMPILAKIEANRNENVQLARIRDGLLPKLMSGEIGVSNIKI